MTELAPDQLTIVRVWVGDDPTTDDLNALYDLTGSVDQTIYLTLINKLALASEQPSSLSVPGLSISYGTLVQNIQALMKEFTMQGGTGLEGETGIYAFKLGQLVRPSTR